ncbi:MAG: hypothetical protein K6E64_04235 [Lachnospiraceae bacterium]|nr:hypothetical protein [Lachnospiraceae bacterium]
MKKRTLKFLALLCVATLAMGMFAGCGSKKSAKKEETKTETTAEKEETTEEDTTEEADATQGTVSEEDAVVSDTADGLLAEVEGEDALVILSGVLDGWAPTVMVVGNDNSFYCLVDYAGQANVNFVQGTWEENADGSITATGALYTDGSEVIIEVAKADDGTYSTDVTIPDVDGTVHLEGTAK